MSKTESINQYKEEIPKATSVEEIDRGLGLDNEDNGFHRSDRRQEPSAVEIWGSAESFSESENTAFTLTGTTPNVEDRKKRRARQKAEDDELYTFSVTKRKPVLEVGKYLAEVGRPSAEKMGDSHKYWVRLTIPFKIKADSGSTTVLFMASKSLNRKGRLYPIIRGILGRHPSDGFDLRSLEGREVRVEVGHNEDEYGNVWEQILSVERVS